ncbi:hypothetical protein BDP55DRAFT_742447 [Colletotrichum godetiae]|uniref:Uncharacterized protein n=1 Tax=Colletotrichum godetiae TaxID=1209918 RepID=A0AAJ0ALZ6_9PEZI|nr:uncharacterized protein BDP55DRAFT_742447 [Colletotrichum godetiae]KAK1676350.1 hypothetical protein BDP55DRAFT_742447 [Colletotrichum godetiae]
MSSSTSSYPAAMDVDTPPTSSFGSSSSFLPQGSPAIPAFGAPSFFPSQVRHTPPVFGAPSSLSSPLSSTYSVGMKVARHTTSIPTEDDLISSFSSFNVGAPATPLPRALRRGKQEPPRLSPLSLMAARVAWAKCRKSKCSPSGNPFRQNHAFYRKYSHISFSPSRKSHSERSDTPRGTSSPRAPADPLGPKSEGVSKRRGPAKGQGRAQVKQQQYQGNRQPPRGPRNSSPGQPRSYPQPARGHTRGPRPNRYQGPGTARNGQNPFTPAVNPFSQPLPKASAPAPPSQPRNRNSRGGYRGRYRGSHRNPISL